MKLNLLVIFSSLLWAKAFHSTSKISIRTTNLARNSAFVFRTSSVTSSVPTIKEERNVQNQQVKEVLAGFVTALATLPTSISYSLVVGIKPLLGVWNSGLMGLSSGLIGGAPGLIIGSAGVTALPMAKIFQSLGQEYMFFSLIAASVIEMLFGVLKLSKFASVIQEPVVSGFLNALGLFILSSQVKVFKAHGNWLPIDLMLPNLSIASLSAFLIYFISKAFPKSPVPPSFIGIIVSSLVANLFKLPIKSLADFVGRQNFQGGLSSLPSLLPLPSHIQFNENTVPILLSTAFGVAIVSIVETIIANRVSYQNFKQTRREHENISANEEVPNDPKDFNYNDYDKTITALGVGNLIAGCFGGYGGCGLIPNTILNNKNGGSTRISSISYAISITMVVLLFSQTLGLIPMAALSGLMFIVALNTIEWHEGYKLLKSSLLSVQSMMNLIGKIGRAHV